jgi:hypothetical protein
MGEKARGLRIMNATLRCLAALGVEALGIYEEC